MTPGPRAIVPLVLFVLTLTLTPGCATASPEETLLGCWTEIDWEYERIDDRSTPVGAWSDGVRLRSYPDRSLVRHEAELWEFRGRGTLAIGDRAGTLSGARWRLKGRGHVLTIRQGEDRFEVYNIKELTPEKLVLHFDLGMEVRGIARLEFQRASCHAAVQTGRLKDLAEDIAS
jgi:hypothetical protein